MNSQKPHTFILSLILLGVLVSSCSTKKKTWFHKQYHNTTAKYNGYFNSKESVKKGVKKLHESHKDDYTKILPLYKIGDLESSKIAQNYMDKAIKKSSIVIQRHSINIRGKEYCKWIDENYLLVGIGYFYKGEFNEAIKTFQFVKNEYKKTKTSHQASLWLIRSFTEKKDFISGEIEITEIKNNRKFPQKLKTELSLVVANYYLKQNNLPLALDQIQQAINTVRKKETKVRLYYISGQIYQQNNNFSRARKHYETVIRLNPEYEMVFNAKMNLARSLESDSRDVEETRQKLFKMIKDDKNKEYLDQIYYTLAKLSLIQKDTVSAIINYKLSTTNSVDNEDQKGRSFMELANIYFAQNEYKKTKPNQDSALVFLSRENQDYKKIKERAQIVSNLVFHLNTIEIEDSLQALAQLPLGELNQIIKKIIDDQAQKEKEKNELEKIKQQAILESGRYGNTSEQFGNKTSGGKWYFYNPSTLSFGFSEFRKKWGKRKLEDDWRRKNKQANTDQTDSLGSASKNQRDESENNKNLSYYMKKIPRTKEAQQKSNSKIKESLYQAGIIYKEQLKRYIKSNEMFQEVLLRFPKDTLYSPLSGYNLYLNYQKQKNKNKAEEVKKMMATQFPNTIYNKMLQDTSYNAQITKNEKTIEKNYNTTYSLYKNQKYIDVLIRTTTIQKNRFKEKTQLLRAMSFIKLNDTINCKAQLTELKKQKHNLKISEQASALLKILEDPSKMEKSNKQAETKSRYLLKEEAKHIATIVLPKNGTDVNYLKTLISDYHKERYSTEVFEINAILFGTNKHLVLIKTLNNKASAMKYYNSLFSQLKIMQEISKTEYKVFVFTEENFQEFYKSKNINEYEDFFKKNYLNERHQ